VLSLSIHDLIQIGGSYLRMDLILVGDMNGSNINNMYRNINNMCWVYPKTISGCVLPVNVSAILVLRQWAIDNLIYELNCSQNKVRYGLTQYRN
jgi:hypothetical protein